MIKTHLSAGVQKTDGTPLRQQKILPVYIFQVLEKSVERRRQAFAPYIRKWIHLISSRPPSEFSDLARHQAGWLWVEPMSRSKSIVARADF